MTIARAAVRGATASGVGALLGFLVRFGANAWISRLVVPEVFGQFAMAWVYTELLSVFMAASFANCIIQFDEDSSLTVAATLRLNGLSGALLALAGGLVAALLWRDSPTQAVLVVALCTARALSNNLGVYDAILQKELRFADLARYRFYGIAASVVAAVALALAGLPYAALIARELLGSVMPALCSIGRIALPWRRALLPDAAARTMTVRAFRLGVQQFWVQALEIAYQRLDQFLLGRLLGPSELGLYAQGRYLAGLPHAAVMPATQTVTLRIFAGASTAPERIRMMLELIQGVVLHVLVLLAIPLAVAPAFIVRVAFGERWGGAAAALPYLAVWIVVLPLVRNVQTALMALFRWRAIRASQIVQLVLLVMCLPAGVHWWGSIGAAVPLSVALVGAGWVALWGLTPAERPRMRSYRGPAAGVLALGLMALLWPHLLEGTTIGLVVRVLAFQCAYVGGVLAADFEYVRALAQRITRELRPREPA